MHHMGNKIRSEKCIHCLQYKNDITDDHGFPAFWYPNNTPQQVQRITVPSCRACNNRLGAIEQEIAVLMWACIDPSKPQAQGLRQKVVEYFGIGVSGLSLKEKEIREELRKKFVGSMRLYKPNSTTKYFPGFGPHSNSPVEEQRAINIPIKKLNAVAEKVIRTLEYRQKGQSRYIENPYKLELFPSVRENELPSVVSMVQQLPVNQHGPGFKITRGMTTDGRDILYRIEFWGTWVVYGFISDETIPRNFEVPQEKVT